MWWSWALSILGVTGLWLIGKKHWWAWGIAFTNECLWMVYAVVTKQYGFIFGALAYGSVHAKNGIQWRNDSTSQEKT